MNTMGETIKRRRKELGMTQTEFAEKLDISSKTVSRWESGVQLPDVILVPEIASVLGISVNELYGITEGPSSDKVYDTPAVSEDIKGKDHKIKMRPVNSKAMSIYKSICIIALVICILGGVWLCVYDALRMSLETGYTIQGGSDPVVTSGSNKLRFMGYLMFFGGMSVLLINHIWFAVFRRKTDKENAIYRAHAIRYGGFAYLLLFSFAGILLPLWIGIPFTEIYAMIVIITAVAVQGGMCFALRLPKQGGITVKRWVPIITGTITLSASISYGAWMLHGAVTALWAKGDGTLKNNSVDATQNILNIIDMTHRMNYNGFLIVSIVILVGLIVIYSYQMRKINEINMK